ncbi:MAG: hypothetical protein IJV31_11335 [Clostridia bacterium]|nr:hypothetical protein [Clostridia bacterium]
MEKSNVLYYQVAREALVKWNGLSEEQADKIIEESSFEEIESKVNAKSSIASAATSIGKSLGLNDEETSQFLNEVFGKIESTEMTEKLHHELESKMLSTFSSSKHYYMPQLITDAIEDVHDNWVEDNASLFFTKKADRGQQYQYLPLELIGWEEAKSDLLFIKPIIHAIGGEIDEDEIKEVCNQRTIKLLEEHSDRGMDGALEMSIHNLDDLGTWIAENGLEYKHWTPEIAEAMSDIEFVKGTILPELREKGFIKDKDLMEKLGTFHIFELDGDLKDKIGKNMNFIKIEDILKLSKEELEKINLHVTAIDNIKSKDGKIGIDEGGLKPEIGSNSNGTFGDEIGKKVFFSQGLEGFLQMVNKSFRIVMFCIENRSNEKGKNGMQDIGIGQYYDDIIRDFKNISNENLKIENITPETRNKFYSLVKKFMETRTYYKLDLNGCTREEYEKLNDEKKKEIDYLSDDYNYDTNHRGKSVTPNNMHTIIDQGVSVDKTHRIVNSDGSILNGFETIMKLCQRYKQMYPGQDFPTIIHNKGTKGQWNDDNWLEKFYEQYQEKDRVLKSGIEATIQSTARGMISNEADVITGETEQQTVRSQSIPDENGDNDNR